MFRKVLVSIALGAVFCFCGSHAWAGDCEDDYIIPGRTLLFDGTVSGLRQAYETFDAGINDSACTDNRELVFLHALTRTIMLAARDDGGENSGVDILGDHWTPYYEALRLDFSILLNEHDAYEIPDSAPDAGEIRNIINNSMIPEIEAIIAGLDSIDDSPGDRFRIYLDPNETRVFFTEHALGLQTDMEVDYGDLLLLKGLLWALKGQLQAQAAYDTYVDPNAMLAEQVYGGSFDINADVLEPYPHFLKVLPTPNDANDGAAVLAQAHPDFIAAIDYFLDAMTYISSEEDVQEDDLLYMDPNDHRIWDVVVEHLTALRNSLDNDTVWTYPAQTTKTFNVYDSGPALRGGLELVHDFTGLEGDEGSLSFSGIAPSEWIVELFGIDDGNELWVEFENYDAGSGWRMAYLDATLALDGNSFSAGTFAYTDMSWTWNEVHDISGFVVSTEVVDVNTDLNPIYGGTARYPEPVDLRDLLPESDEWNGPLPGTMGHGLGDDATLGGIFPDMNQTDWQVLLSDVFQPGGIAIIGYATPTIDGDAAEWTSAELVLEDVAGDTDEPNTVGGVDVDKLYLAYDSDYLYGAITFHDNITGGINYWRELSLSYSPDYEESLDTIVFAIENSGTPSGTLYHTSDVHGPPCWEYVCSFEAVTGLNAVEFRIPRADIEYVTGAPAPLPGRFVYLESEGWDPVSWEWDGEDNHTHLKIAGLGASSLGTISGTVTYSDYDGAPIFIQACTDPWDPEYSIVTSTMITAPGPYTLEGIGIGCRGYIRAFTPLFGFNVFDLEALVVETSAAGTLTSSPVTDADLTLNSPTVLTSNVWVDGEIEPAYDKDWYAFHAIEGCEYALDVDRFTSTIASMTLYGRDGHTELAELHNWQTQHIDWDCPVTGTYYIKVANDSPDSDTGTYKVRMTGASLWGHWRMNDCAANTDVLDSSGSGNDGTSQANTSTLATTGIIDGALSFDGLTDYVSIPEQIESAFAGDFTITLWVRFDSMNPKWWESAFVAQDQGGGPQNKWIFSYNPTSRRTLFHVNGPGTGGPVISGNEWVAETDVWYSLGLSRSGSTYTFYKQGVADGSQVDSVVLPDVASALTIGWAEGPGKFDGSIDDVRIYSGALPPADIESLCNLGPAAHWKMDDDAGSTTVVDSIAGANDGVARSFTSDLSTDGVIDSALTFDGSDDYIEVPDAGIGWAFEDDFTITLWARFDSFNPKWWESAFVAQDSGGGPANKWIFSYSPTSQRTLFHINGPGTGGPVITGEQWIAAEGAWYFVGLSRNGDTYTFYRQGVPDGSQVDSTVLPDVASPLTIGWAEGPGGKFDGAIDDVRIYSRALSDLEMEAVCDAGPAAYWKMDDDAADTTVIDSIGRANDGDARRNTDDLTTPGVTHTALSLNGSTDYIVVPERLEWVLAMDFTISLWARFDSFNPKWWESAFASQDQGGGPANKWIFSYDPASSRSLFHINGPGTGAPLITGNPWTAETGQWYFIALTRTGTGTYTFYHQNACDGSQVNTEAIPDVSGPWRIGWAEGGGTFDGAIDDVRVHNRALSHGEIEGLYAAAIDPGGQIKSLLGHWKMDDNASNATVLDSSGIGNHGTARRNTSELTTAGIIDSALVSDGAGDYISVPDRAEWSFAADFTIALWVKYDSFNPKWWESAFVAQDPGGGPQNKWIFSYAPTTDRTVFHINGPGTGGPVITGDSWAALPAHWYFVAITRSGSTYSFYVQGDPASSEANTTVIPDVSAPLTIGWAEGGGAKFAGTIDDVRIYDGALSPAEIQTLYNAGAGL